MSKTEYILEKGLIRWKDLFLKTLYAMRYGSSTTNHIICEFDALNRKNIWVRLLLTSIEEDSDGFFYNTGGFQRRIIIQGVHESEFYCNYCNQVFHNSCASKQRKGGSNQCKSCFNKQKRDYNRNQPPRSGRYLRHLTNGMFKGYSHICGNTSKKINIIKGEPGTKHHEIIGCTSEEFREYINEQLEDGWTLQNYGEVWELDHIISLNTFDLTDFEQLKRAGHYSNVRPLSVLDNRKKYNKLEEEDEN
jgi:hypothetical protein